MRARELCTGLAVSVLALGACTESNPGYTTGDTGSTDASWHDQGAGFDAGPTADKGPGADGTPADTLPPTDTVPWPDVVPWQCAVDADCDDGITCTADKCTAQNTCEITTQPNACLIGKVCYKKDDPNPANSCQSCQPAASTSSWTSAADNAPCAPDAVPCTLDICKAGSCVHPLAPAKCLIDGQCLDDGDLNPQNSCEACASASSTSQWTTLADQSPCASDGLTCTTDLCKGGTCDHSLNDGWCLINKVCYADGDFALGDACNECATDKSQTAWTFVAGKPCASGTGLAQMCYAGQCRGWTQSLYAPPPNEGALTTALNGVDHIPAANGVWAVGQFTAASLPPEHGVLVPLGAITPVAGAVITKAPLRAIHYRLAVGEQGQAWYHDGTKWVEHAGLSAGLGSTTRHGVYGGPSGGGETFFISGPHDANGLAGVIRCSLPSTGSACISYSGFDSSALLGRVFAVIPATGPLGPAWAVNTDLAGNQPEDIYAYPGTGTTWSLSPPLGCEDSGNTPCGNTWGAFVDMYGSGGSDVWVVGSYGNLLHYDGTGWNRLQNQFSTQSSQTLNAVYASPAAGLVTIVGHRNTTTGRVVALFNRNIELDRWFGPIIISQVPANDIDEIRDIGGKGYGDLWMVGRKLDVGPGGTPLIKGWILHFD